MPCRKWYPPKQIAGNIRFSSSFLPLLCVLLYHVVIVHASFMSTSKAVFPQGCSDQWTPLDRNLVPPLGQMTLCVDVRVTAPGKWTAFSYTTAEAEPFQLGLQGDRASLYVWFLGQRLRFPIRFALQSWHRMCLQHDALQPNITLLVDGATYQRTVGPRALPPGGELTLGCDDEESSSGSNGDAGQVQLYLFRVWDDVRRHGSCEDGNVIGWRSEHWRHETQAMLQDETLLCGQRREKREAHSRVSIGITTPPPTNVSASPPTTPITTSSPVTPLTTCSSTTPTTIPPPATPTTVPPPTTPTTTPPSTIPATTPPQTTPITTTSPITPLTTSSSTTPTTIPPPATPTTTPPSTISATTPPPTTPITTSSPVTPLTTSSSTTPTTIPPPTTPTTTPPPATPATTPPSTISATTPPPATPTTTPPSTISATTPLPTTPITTSSPVTPTTTPPSTIPATTPPQTTPTTTTPPITPATNSQPTETPPTTSSTLTSTSPPLTTTPSDSPVATIIITTVPTTSLPLTTPLSLSEDPPLTTTPSDSPVATIIITTVPTTSLPLTTPLSLSAVPSLTTTPLDSPAANTLPLNSPTNTSTLSINSSTTLLNTTDHGTLSTLLHVMSTQWPSANTSSLTTTSTGALTNTSTGVSTTTTTGALANTSTSALTNTSTGVSTTTSTSVSNTTSTSVSNTTSTTVSNTTSTGVSNTTSTNVSNTTSTGVSNTTSTNVSNTTSTGVSNTTSTGVSTTTSTSVSNTTSTGVSNTTSTNVSNTTSTGVSNTTSTGVSTTTSTGVSNTTSTSVSNTTSTSVSNTTSTGVSNTTSTGVSNTTSSTTEPRVWCSFSSFCSNETAYYLMTLAVKANRSQTETSDIAAEIPPLFGSYMCPAMMTTGPSPSVRPTANISTTTQSWTSNISAPSGRERTCVKDGDTGACISQVVMVTCDMKENVGPLSTTKCTVLLQLSCPTNTCWIQQVVKGMENSLIQTSLVGNVERVGMGNCKSTVNLTSGFVKCDSVTLNPEDCLSTSPINVTCDRYAETIYVPLETNRTETQSCAITNSSMEPICECSAYCSGTVDYYSFTLEITNPALTYSDVTDMISQLNSTNCSSYFTTPSSICPLFSTISKIYQGYHLHCQSTGTSLQSCRVILKLAERANVCGVATVLGALLQSDGVTISDNVVTRVAICGWSSEPNTDMLNATFTWISFSVPSQFCLAEIPNYSFCQKGKKICLLLNESCSTSLPSTHSPSTAQPLNITSQPNVTEQNTGTGTATPVSPETEAEGLLNITKNVLALNSSQVENLVSEVQNLISGPKISLVLGTTVTSIVSNLLNASAQTLASSSTRIIQIVDTVGLKLVLPAEAETILSESLALAVKKVEASNFNGTSFTIFDSSNLQISSNGNLSGRVATSPQGSISLPASLLNNLSSQDQLLASRIQFNFYQKSTLFVDRALGNRSLNSGVLGTSVNNLSISGLTDSVTVTLRNSQPIPASGEASCVYWDFSRNNGSGGWNPLGCHVKNRNDEETVCSCNHLTSFGVLLDISREGINNTVQEKILTFITYIGCGVSAIFLSITILTYLAFEKLLKDIPAKILVQLCVALLLLNLVFLLDPWLALYRDVPGLCISTAFFLHYFLLASFTWMGLEAFHMYLALVKVFNTYVSRYMLKFSLVGWGVPLIVVIIVIAINKDNYGLISYKGYTSDSSDEFCWLRNDIAFYVSVVAYFCLVFLLNLTMFVVVVVQLQRIKRENPHNSQHRSTLQDLRSLAGLTFLLGLTWGFAFFAWGPVNLAFMYLFAIFNSLQGFFIFIFHCAIKDSVRRHWRMYLCCGKLRLAENSEWSRTATQKILQNQSNIMGDSFHSSKSAQSINSSSTSSFLTNESPEKTNGIGGPFEDRIIAAMEDPNTDVVLNEINNRRRNPRTQ